MDPLPPLENDEVVHSFLRSDLSSIQSSENSENSEHSELSSSEEEDESDTVGSNMERLTSQYFQGISWDRSKQRPVLDHLVEENTVLSRLTPFFSLILDLRSMKKDGKHRKRTQLPSFPLKSKECRSWDPQIFKRLVYILHSQQQKTEAWLTSTLEWIFIASLIFLQSACKGEKLAKKKGDQEGSFFSQAIGTEFIDLEDLTLQSFTSTYQLEELCVEDKGWEHRLILLCKKLYQSEIAIHTALSFLQQVRHGFFLYQNECTGLHQALLYHPALACLEAGGVPKVFPRATKAVHLGNVEVTIDSMGDLVLYSNQHLKTKDALLWSLLQNFPFNHLNTAWNRAVVNKMEQAEASIIQPHRSVETVLLFQMCRLTVFKPYRPFDDFIQDPQDRAFSDIFVQRLLAHCMDAGNMDVLRCKAPILSSEEVEDGIFASLLMRSILYALCASFLHRVGLDSFFDQASTHHLLLHRGQKGFTGHSKNTTLRQVKKAEEIGMADQTKFWFVALLRDQFTELCFLLFPPQGSYLSEQLGYKTLLNFALVVTKCYKYLDTSSVIEWSTGAKAASEGRHQQFLREIDDTCLLNYNSHFSALKNERTSLSWPLHKP